MISVAHQIVNAIETHNFAVGHDFSNHAVDFALTKGTANLVMDYLDLVAGLSLAVGMVVVMVGAMRVGLLTRWVGVLGIFSGVLIFLPIGGATLEVVPAFWLVAMGLLCAERWPNGDPPAWSTGEARPWPTRAALREANQATAGKVLAATSGCLTGARTACPGWFLAQATQARGAPLSRPTAGWTKRTIAGEPDVPDG